MTGSVLSTAYYAPQHPTQPQLSSQTATYATRQLAQLFAAAQHNPFFILAFFVSLLSRRAFSHPHTHTSKLICAISQKLRKAKTVVVAPNIEQIESEGGLDDLLGSILKQAEDFGLPVVFALSRKKMGQVLVGPRAGCLACSVLNPWF